MSAFELGSVHVRSLINEARDSFARDQEEFVFDCEQLEDWNEGRGPYARTLYKVMGHMGGFSLPFSRDRFSPLPEIGTVEDRVLMEVMRGHLVSMGNERSINLYYFLDDQPTIIQCCL